MSQSNVNDMDDIPLNDIFAEIEALPFAAERSQSRPRSPLTQEEMDLIETFRTRHEAELSLHTRTVDAEPLDKTLETEDSIRYETTAAPLPNLPFRDLLEADVKAEPSPNPGSTRNEDKPNDEADDDQWDLIEHSELNTTTFTHDSIPSAVLVPASFAATWEEYKERYSLSEEQIENIKAACTILCWTGGIAFNMVSAPLIDAAAWVVRRQLGCDLEDLPEELRARTMASLPQNVQRALRVSSRTLRRGGGFIVPGDGRVETEDTSGDDW